MKNWAEQAKFWQELGKRLRAARTKFHISQKVAGAAVGVSCQQWQKYENDTNCILVSRLYWLSQMLNMNIDDFIPKCDSKEKDESSQLPHND